MALASAFFGGAVRLGDQIASASPTMTSAADIISAATNANGIIITSFTATCQDYGTGGASTSTLKILIDSDEIMRLTSVSRGSSQIYSQAPSFGGFCNVEIPAGYAVSYDFTLGSGQAVTDIYITWKHKL